MTRPGASRQRVQRADGRTINVARRRGHLSYCFHGCCCGRTDKGYVAAPVDTYKDEWTRRKIRNQVHLTKAGCLGPCALSNVAHLVFDGHDVWFHSVNDAWLVVAIFDYIGAMLAADGFLSPPRNCWNTPSTTTPGTRPAPCPWPDARILTWRSRSHRTPCQAWRS
ncbi:hypothetical protein ACFSC4_23550 [Deinococcus malanensis]|uniref:hypothetical protein n=1 Tax=Deinococcus malanensis TaxID=1706855 RepID=UPI00362DDABD